MQFITIQHSPIHFTPCLHVGGIIDGQYRSYLDTTISHIAEVKCSAIDAEPRWDRMMYRPVEVDGKVVYYSVDSDPKE